MLNGQEMDTSMWKIIQVKLPMFALGLAGLVVSAVSGCSHTMASAQSPAGTTAAPEGMPPCALAVPGTTATTYETADGINIEFTTTGSAAEVRRRMVGRIAYGKAHPSPMPVQMTRGTEEISGGIRIIVRSVDPTKVEQVRAIAKKQLADQEQAQVDKAGWPGAPR